jgi:uncharacterized membrane protein
MQYFFFSAVWNVFLAVIPVFLGLALAAGIRATRSWKWLWIWLPLALAWLVFLPNTSYLLTGWRHFFSFVEQQDLVLGARQNRGALLQFLFVAGCYLVYCGLGLLTFNLAVRPLERVAREKGVPVTALAAPFFLLVAHGVYLGLVLRFNSWDLALRPATVIDSSLEALRRPELVGLTAGFALFLWLAYLVVDIWLDGLVLRWKRWTAPGLPAPDRS